MRSNDGTGPEHPRGSCNTRHVTTPEEPPKPSPLSGGLFACPSCNLLTLEVRGQFQICVECSWEDDGQDDPHADEVWGGPNGTESLTDARRRYAQYVSTTRATDPRSAANGGPGRWRSRPNGHRS
ncbi:CPCC family cysteine-rich protein [Streptomyces sp. NPDC058011]|uniref:CPCC family cysteine-rich protein n=1 Tax=Streptomyces sp. NPDC058011 TaxID=3346305 RepID=UPI0036F07859